MKYDKPLLFEGESKRGSKIKDLFGIKPRAMEPKDAPEELFYQWLVKDILDKVSVSKTISSALVQQTIINKLLSVKDPEPTLSCCGFSGQNTCCGNFFHSWKPRGEAIMNAKRAIKEHPEVQLYSILAPLEATVGPENTNKFTVQDMLIIMASLIEFGTLYNCLNDAAVMIYVIEQAVRGGAELEANIDEHGADELTGLEVQALLVWFNYLKIGLSKAELSE